MQNSQVVVTKLYKPVITDQYILRKKVIERLENNRFKPLTLVVAATGYGKSVTISEWLDYTKAKHCWISLDTELNDLRLFLDHIVQSVRKVSPDSFPVLSELLDSQEFPTESTLSQYLINELDEMEEELIIVLDDYHSINNQQIHNLVDELLKYCPPKSHLVIITRKDPPLKVSTLKTFGNVNEIRMSDLSFTKDETISLVSKMSNIEVSNKLIEKLLEKTEGWIVGLRLALLTIAKNKNLEMAIEEIVGNKHFFAQYLLDEVFLNQGKDIQDILLVSSIFDRFNKDLLKSMLNLRILRDEKTSDLLFDSLFERFKNSSLLIISLDKEGEWFRYHHFFREFLLGQLEKRFTQKQIYDFHKGASEYFEKNYLLEEAIKHAIKSNDFDYAAKIFENIKYALIDNDQITRLSILLQQFPKAVIEKQPHLILTSAFLRDALGEYIEMGNELRIAEKLLETNQIDEPVQNQLKGEFHAIHSCFSFFIEGAEKSLKHSKLALELLHLNTSYIYDFTLGFHCMALNAIGEFEKAISLLKKHESDVLPTQPISLMRKLVINSLVNGFHSNFPEILSLAKKYLPICIHYKLWRSSSYGSYFLSEIYYQWNELDKVEEYVNVIDAHKYDSLPYYVINTFFAKAFMHQAQGNIEGLDLCLLDINSFINNHNNELMSGLVKSFEVELAMRDNDIEEADKISKHANFNVYPPILFSFIPQLTEVKLLINIGGNKIVEGEKRLKELVEFGRSNYNSNLLIQALALQSVLYKKLGNDELALKSLNESLALAEPRGHIRTFLDLGKELEIMIKQFSEKNQNNMYIKQLLKSFEQENKLKSTSYSKSRIKLTRNSIFIDDQLSAKEINLLKLVAEGYRNKEIADKLNLSIDSIKKYLSFIYQKLGVPNRTTAISKANKMGLV